MSGHVAASREHCLPSPDTWQSPMPRTWGTILGIYLYHMATGHARVCKALAANRGAMWHRRFHRLAVRRLYIAEHPRMTLPTIDAQHTPCCRHGISRTVFAECNTRQSRYRGFFGHRRVFPVLGKQGFPCGVLNTCVCWCLPTKIHGPKIPSIPL